MGAVCSSCCPDVFASDKKKPLSEAEKREVEDARSRAAAAAEARQVQHIVYIMWS